MIDTWECVHVAEVHATPQDLWRELRDASNWQKWHGLSCRYGSHRPLEIGDEFVTAALEQGPMRVRVVGLRENVGILEHAWCDNQRVRITYLTRRLPAELERIICSALVSGDHADTLGPSVSRHLEGIIASLKHSVAAHAN